MSVRVVRNHDINRYGFRVRGKTHDNVSRFGFEVEREASARAPIRSGLLKARIKSTMVGEFEVHIGAPGVPYDRIQDIGGTTSNQYGPTTGFIHGTHYLTGAFNDKLNAFRKRQSEAMGG